MEQTFIVQVSSALLFYTSFCVFLNEEVEKLNFEQYKFEKISSGKFFVSEHIKFLLVGKRPAIILIFLIVIVVLWEKAGIRRSKSAQTMKTLALTRLVVNYAKF